jgi:MFS transporter, putative metabolite:H+ symporter
MKIAHAVYAGARLDRLPIGRFHRKVLWMVGAGVLMDAFDVYLAAGVLAAMLKEGFSDIEANARFLSWGFGGMLLGAACAGYVGDRFGRRAAYQINLLIFGIASLASMFAPSIEALTWLRFVMGVGLGADVVAATGALAEFIPPSHRGRWMSLFAIIVNCGFVASTVVGYFVIPALGWRWMFGIAGLGALAVWAARKNMPESPRWLEAMGRGDEAERVLAAIETSVAGEHGALPPVVASVHSVDSALPFAALFSRATLPRTILAVLIAVSTLVSIFGFIVWLPTFMVSQGNPLASSLGHSIVLSVGAPLGGAVGFLVADRSGRKASIVVTCIAIIALGSIYSLCQTPVALSIAGFLLVTAIYTLVALGIYVYVPEFFPTSIRLRGIGFASMCGRAASIASPFLAVVGYREAGLAGTLAIVCGLLVMLIGALLAFGVETASSPLESAISAHAAPDGSEFLSKRG